MFRAGIYDRLPARSVRGRDEHPQFWMNPPDEAFGSRAFKISLQPAMSGNDAVLERLLQHLFLYSHTACTMPTRGNGIG
jgi:hypothetical protein